MLLVLTLLAAPHSSAPAFTLALGIHFLLLAFISGSSILVHGFVPTFGVKHDPWCEPFLVSTTADGVDHALWDETLLIYSTAGGTYHSWCTPQLVRTSKS